MTNEMEAVSQVRSVLQAFQDGYTHRDPARLDEFMDLFIAGDELEVIGTGATLFAESEWCIGRAAVRDLVESDWKYWGDLSLDVAGARIYTLGDAAWLAAGGTVKDRFEKESGSQNYLDYIEQIKKQDLSAEAKLVEVLYGAAHTISELSKGENFLWPIRFTAVLVRSAGKWRFHQVQFSFPTTRFPDERIPPDAS